MKGKTPSGSTVMDAADEEICQHPADEHEAQNGTVWASPEGRDQREIDGRRAEVLWTEQWKVRQRQDVVPAFAGRAARRPRPPS